MVHPYLEIVTEVGFIEIVENYSLFAVVAIEPLTLGLVIYSACSILVSGIV